MHTYPVRFPFTRVLITGILNLCNADLHVYDRWRSAYTRGAKKKKTNYKLIIFHNITV